MQAISDGKVISINIWQTTDQSGNRPDAAFHNARMEGVSGRVEIRTVDMRQLPFPDQSFEAIVSHWSVHNLPNVDERSTALSEMHRVLKPFGQLVLADIEHHSEYAAAFEHLGFTEIRHVGDSPKTTLLSAISFGSFRRTAVLARKPAAHPYSNNQNGS